MAGSDDLEPGPADCLARSIELEEDDDIADELYIASVIDSLWT